MKSLVVENLTCRYPDGKPGLAGASIVLEQGMRVALVGENGSGKTTLLFNIAGFLDGDGYISVMGIDRTGKTMKEIRKRIGFIFSSVEYQFIMPDLLNDVMLSLAGRPISGEEKRKQAIQWLERFGLGGLAATHPLDLSSGEMKRAALAAVLAREPDLLLMDEPLNSLDRKSSLGLLGILKELDTTMLMATHRKLLAEELATHIAVMEKGTVTGFHTTEKGLKRSDVRNLLF